MGNRKGRKEYDNCKTLNKGSENIPNITIISINVSRLNLQITRQKFSDCIKNTTVSKKYVSQKRLFLFQRDTWVSCASPLESASVFPLGIKNLQPDRQHIHCQDHCQSVLEMWC